MSKKHARLSCSGSKRWIACPGSILLGEKAPEEAESPYAAEGTTAHWVGESALKEDKEPKDYIGQVCPETGMTVTKEMAEAVTVYTDHIRDIVAASDIMRIEEQFSLEWLYPGMFGTNDCMIFQPATKLLIIDDYKHGEGVVVEPEWNTQLMMYAIGAMYKLWNSQTEITKKQFSILDIIETVRLEVIQPRAFHEEGSIRSWEVSARDLMFWALHVLRPAAIATEDSEARRCVGEHCKFCRALAICPEQARTALELAKTEFNNPVLPDPSELTPEHIAKVLFLSKVIADWAKQVAGYAQNQMEMGVQVPGQKLVAKKVNRQWVGEDKVVKHLKSILSEDEVYLKKLAGITAIESALKDRGYKPAESKDIMEPITFKPEAGLTIAPETDRRKAVAPPAAMDFLDTLDVLQ